MKSYLFKIFLILIVCFIIYSGCSFANSDSIKGNFVRIDFSEVELVPGEEIEIPIKVNQDINEIYSIYFSWESNFIKKTGNPGYDESDCLVVNPNFENYLDEDEVTNYSMNTYSLLLDDYESLNKDDNIVILKIKVREDLENVIEEKFIYIKDIIIDAKDTCFESNELAFVSQTQPVYYDDEKSLFLKTTEYKIGEEKEGLLDEFHLGDTYISRVSANTTIQEFLENKNNIDTNATIKKIFDKDGNEISIDNYNSTFVGTGMTLYLSKGEDIIQLKIAVLGDVNGDGKVTITDFVAANDYILENEVLEGVFLIAADIDENKEVTITDFVAINDIILNEKKDDDEN